MFFSPNSEKNQTHFEMVPTDNSNDEELSQKQEEVGDFI